MTVSIQEVQPPTLDNSGQPVQLSQQTVQERKNKLLQLMASHQVSSLIIYADKEHGGNFEYLTGFIPRFEEALLILNCDGPLKLILGNENYNKAAYSLSECKPYLASVFSLPNQPNHGTELLDALIQAEVDQSQSVGLVDWKLMPNTNAFSIPHYIVESIYQVVEKSKVSNRTDLLIHPQYGVRISNNANEIARYEFGASLASDSLLLALNQLEVGVSEMAMGSILQSKGQLPSVVTIAAFGNRFENANLYPTDRRLAIGDKVALTIAHKGGLSSRSGYAVSNQDELGVFAPEYLEKMVIPYFEAYQFWLKNMKVGLHGGTFYEEFCQAYPPEQYGWTLNPGHLVADEEWLSSPFYHGSEALVQSGMIFQVDFIPSIPGMQGVSAESTVAVAGASLRDSIQREYPELWHRIQKRRDYIQDQLQLPLHQDLLPMTSTLAYYRPYFLNAKFAITF